MLKPASSVKTNVRELTPPMSAPSTFGERALRFYRNLTPPKVAGGVEIIEPHQDATVMRLMSAFFQRYFADDHARIFAIGINPGRHGSGMTGIPFTDPVALAQDCGIANGLPQRRELTSDFTYQFIRNRGGPAKFYRDFFLTSISPLGFTREGRNCNYYDDSVLFASLRPFIIESFERQIEFGAHRSVAIVIGSGSNFAEITRLNSERRWFDRLLVVEHPRYIMQYRRAELDDYLERYQATFENACQIAVAASGGTHG